MANNAQAVADRVWKLDLDWLWWTMFGLGILIILFFGFCVCIDPAKAVGGALFSAFELKAPTESGHCGAPWRSWELGAVAWSILFGFYYLLRLPILTDAAQYIKLISLLVFLAIIVPFLAGLSVWLAKPVIWHVGVVMVGGFLFMLADILLYNRLCKFDKDATNVVSDDDKIKNFKHEREKRLYWESVIVADTPMLAGLLVLFGYLWFHRGQGSDHDMEAFAGGAISFQLIASNVLFALGQGGFIRSVWEDHIPLESLGIKKGTTNMWVAPALMCSIFGLILPFVRLLGTSNNHPVWIASVSFLLGAVVFSVLGHPKVGKLGGPSGTGLVNSALSLAILGVVLLVALPYLLVALPHRSSVFSAEKLKDLGLGSTLSRVEACANVKYLALSPDGSMLACVDSVQGIILISTKTGEPIPGFSLGSRGTFSTVTFSPDGGKLATGGKSVELLNLTGQQEAQLEQPIGLSASEVSCLAFSRDGEILAGASADKIYLWDTKTGRALRRHNETDKDKAADKDSAALKLEDAMRSVRVLAFSADGRWLAAGGIGTKILVWKITPQWRMSKEDNEDKVELDDPKIAEPWEFWNIGGQVDSLALSRDGMSLAAGLDNGSVMIWEDTRDFKKRGEPSPKPIGGASVLALLFSEDAGLLAAATANPGVTLVDTQPGGKWRALPAAKAASVIVFSLDGSTVASGDSATGDLNVWRSQ